MRFNWSQYRGKRVTIDYQSGGSVEGWLLGEIPQGVLVAVDDNLKDIRLITDPGRIFFHNEKNHPTLSHINLKEIQDRLQATNSAISGPLDKALSNIKFDRLYEFGKRADDLWIQIRHFEHRGHDFIRKTDSSARYELAGFLLAQTDRSVALHKEIYDTVTVSGLAEVLDEFGSSLTSVPPEFTLPAYDLEFTSREELITTFQSSRDTRWTVRRHQASISLAEETRTRLLVDATNPALKEKPEVDEKDKKADDSTALSRWIGPSLRILAGTGLATANAALGITAGLTTAVTTIGATAVPIYVGVATSMYTGLTQACDGLEKIGRYK